jgi:hypothetical protein
MWPLTYAGDYLPLHLTWRGRLAREEDLKETLHLITSDSRPHNRCRASILGAGVSPVHIPYKPLRHFYLDVFEIFK